jgi:hypothetical protein
MAVFYTWAHLAGFGGWQWQAIILGCAFGLLFLYAAVSGRSPRRLEEWLGKRQPPVDGAP